MKQVPLRARDGSVRAYARVDEADYASLMQFRWCLLARAHTSYAVRMEAAGRRPDGRVRQRTVYMHRQIMGEPLSLVDHWDHDGLNNQRANLRLVTNAENMQNRRGAAANSSTGLRGVSPRGARWRAQATADGVCRHLGYFGTPEEAAEAVRAFWAARGQFVAGLA